MLQAYWEAPVPQPGEDFEFNPDASLQPIHYRRSKLHDASPLEYVHRAAIVAAESEAADGLRVWTVANLCRSLSLENILTLLTGADSPSSFLRACWLLPFFPFFHSQLGLLLNTRIEFPMRAHHNMTQQYNAWQEV